MTDDRHSVSLAAGIAYHRRRGRPPRAANSNLTPAGRFAAYVETLNGTPAAPPWRHVYPLPVLDPDVAVLLRRAAIRTVGGHA